MHELIEPASIAALLTLTILEIVLGIDNIVFIAIVTGKLPPEQQAKARTIGLLLAAVGRIILLFGISLLIKASENTLFELPFVLPGAGGVHGDGLHEALSGPQLEALDAAGLAVEGHAAATTTAVTWKDLILFLGGMFLVGKATWEIGHALEPHDPAKKQGKTTTFANAMVSLFMVNLVFSIDSVLTAVGMVNPDEYETAWVPLTIMILGVVISIGIMLAFAKPVVHFVNHHPSVKMLALAFLILIGVVLVAEAFHAHVPRGYIYFSMAFALFVEVLNLRARKARKAATHPEAEEAGAG